MATERDENRQWLTSTGRYEGRQLGEWAQNLVDRFGIEGALDILAVTGDSSLYGVDLRRSPWAGRPWLREMVRAARETDHRLSRSLYLVAQDPAWTPAEQLHVHHIEIALSTGGTVTPRITCSAPVGAPCRLHCGICEDYPREDHASHELHDMGYCLFVEGWFDDSSVIFEMYDGGETELRSGPVDLSWDGDGVLWSYAGTESTS